MKMLIHKERTLMINGYLFNMVWFENAVINVIFCFSSVITTQREANVSGVLLDFTEMPGWVPLMPASAVLVH